MKQNKCIIINDNYNITNKLTMSYHSEIEQQAGKKIHDWEANKIHDWKAKKIMLQKWDPFSEFNKRTEKEEFRLRLQKEEFTKEKEERQS